MVSMPPLTVSFARRPVPVRHHELKYLSASADPDLVEQPFQRTCAGGRYRPLLRGVSHDSSDLSQALHRACRRALRLPRVGCLRCPSEEEPRSLEDPAQGVRDPLAHADRADGHLDGTHVTTSHGAAHPYSVEVRPMIDAHGAWCLRHAHRDRAVALAASGVIREEGHVIHPAVAPSPALRAQAGDAASDPARIGARVAHVLRVDGLVLVDASDGDGHRIAVGIGNADNGDVHELVVRRP